jgi:protein tyrosine/serine phosphatase
VARELQWEGCLNVRDLGGIPTEDGAETSFGVVVRSDNVQRLRDLQTLERHGIARVVDLRFDDELAADAPRHLPVEVVRVPLVRFDAQDRALLEERAAALAPAEYLEWSYLHVLDEFRGNFGRAVRAIAESDGTVCVHCMGGRDRTGLVTALLLRVAGVSAADIAEDYWLSEEPLREDHELWVAEALNEVEARVRSVFLVAPREVMVGVIATLEEQYGSVRGYLRAAGVPDDELNAFVARLRGAR